MLRSTVLRAAAGAVGLAFISKQLPIGFLQSTILRAAAGASSVVPSLNFAVRFQSSKADDLVKKAREIQNDMLRDWQAPILTYEELKPRTISPSPVRPYATTRHAAYHCAGRVFD